MLKVAALPKNRQRKLGKAKKTIAVGIHFIFFLGEGAGCYAPLLARSAFSL
jgi:hypothetical protein